jgi:signal transduction histidine kinase
MKTMKKNLSSQFFICYLLIGIVCFLVVAAGGSFLMERRLERDAGQKIYEEARQIAADDVFSKYSLEDVISKSSLSDSLNYVSYYLDYEIWITDENGTLLFDTSDKGFWATESYILAFASEITSDHPYAIGTFDDCFSAEQLSVLAPVTDSATTKGYILIHYPLRNIYQNRDIYREVMLVIFFIIYALVFFLFIFYRVYIHTPLQEIVKGATQFENGNFTYRIPVKFDDEMGYLANSLNYMADRLNENGEYQHQVIANVSHDFRSPLTSIKGYVEAILDGTIPPEMQDKYLKIISMESERLEKLTHSLTMLGDFDKRKRLLYMTRFDINKTIRLACATFEGTCDRRDIRLELYLAGTELFVWADK